MEWITGIFSAFGLSASAGLNAYIPLIIVGLLNRYTGLIHLKEPWDSLSSWWVLGVLLVLSLVEFFADKIPAVNHINDLIQTLVRPTAGAIAFAASAGAVTEVNPVFAMILGLVVAGGVHATKSLAVRPAVTATTAGAGNVPVSILEDVISSVVSLVSVMLPILVGIALLLFAFVLAWFFMRRSRTRPSSSY